MMPDTASPKVLRELLQRYQFRIKKKFGQNFLIDGNIINNIVTVAEVNNEDLVIEIGPGAGALTTRLAQLARQVVAVEIDPGAIAMLTEVLAPQNNVHVVQGDALKVDLDALATQENFATYKVVANLPYYITTPLLMHLLEQSKKVNTIVVMVQEEVARRLAASPGSKDYGALTLAADYYAQVSLAFKVPRSVFMPRPEVDSAVVCLKVRETPEVHVKEKQVLFALIKAAFQQRRKTLLNSLNTIGELSKEQRLQIFEQAGIDPVRRGETLSLAEFSHLAEIFTEFLRR